jgi:hypothetical protein
MPSQTYKNETDLLQACRIEASKLGATVFRNNTGKLQDKTGRWVDFGLCVGSSDLIGWHEGKFLAIEVKMPGKKPTSQQLNFIDAVNHAGGLGGWVTDPSHIRALLFPHDFQEQLEFPENAT